MKQQCFSFTTTNESNGWRWCYKKKDAERRLFWLVLPQLMKAMDSKGSVIKNKMKKKIQKGSYFWGERIRKRKKM